MPILKLISLKVTIVLPYNFSVFLYVKIIWVVAIPHNKAYAASGCMRSLAFPKFQADIYYSPKNASEILKTSKLPQL